MITVFAKQLKNKTKIRPKALIQATGVETTAGGDLRTWKQSREGNYCNIHTHRKCVHV